MGMKQFSSQRINIVIYHTTAALLTYCLLEQIGFCTKSMGMKQFNREFYREIHTKNDTSILQQDLQTLSDWSAKWFMAFNVKKCASLTITRKRTPIQHDYRISNEIIPRIDKYKYLGVTVTKDLRWNTHCQLLLNKANKTLGLLRRTLSPCTKDVKSRAYTALVRPQLEYGAEAWNPHTSGAAEGLERVQKTAARFVFRDYRRSTSATGLVSQLGWDKLHTRRLLAQSTMLFKIHHQLVNICLPHLITKATYISRRDHTLKLSVPVATIDSYKYSFYPRTIRIWNQLPATAVTTPNSCCFPDDRPPCHQRVGTSCRFQNAVNHIAA